MCSICELLSLSMLDRAKFTGIDILFTKYLFFSVELLDCGIPLGSKYI